MPVCGWYVERAFVEAVGFENADKSIQWAVCVEHIVAIVDDGAEAGARDPEVMPAVGLQEIAKLSQEGFRLLERHLRRRLVAPRWITTAARDNKYIEKPQRLRQTLDELDHKLHVPAGRRDSQTLLSVGESLPLEDIVILMRCTLF